jgi:hypothetical protein
VDERPFTTVLLIVAGVFPVLLGVAALVLRSEIAFGVALALAVLYVPAAAGLGD